MSDLRTRTSLHNVYYIHIIHTIAKSNVSLRRRPYHMQLDSEGFSDQPYLLYLHLLMISLLLLSNNKAHLFE